MSEEISPQSEKMDISDTSIDQQSETELLDNNEHCTKPEQLSLTSITTATTAANKTISKSTVTNSHPLMYSPESDVLPITNYNFNPIAHSSTLNLVRSSSFDLDCPDIESYRVELPEFPSSPSALKKNFDFPVEIDPDLSDTENDRSVYEAVLSPNLQNVSLTMNEKQSGNLNFLAQVSRSNKLRKIKVVPTTQSGDSDVSSIDSVSDSIKSDDVFPENRSLDMNFIKELLESPDIDDSVLEPPEYVRTENESKPGESPAEPIHEYSAEEERRESRHWQKIVLPNGEQRNIDMRVIEPYKRVMSHGGYLKAGGHNAIIVFSACYLPDKSRKDYVYVMDNLFLYVLQTLDQLITEDYVLVYLHGSASSNCIPTIGWLKRCYQLIDRRLRKNLKQLYLVHPTFWIKTVIMMTKPFISTKFYRKLHFINSIQELTNCLPIEQAAIPERVINYDKVKFST